MRDVLDQGTCIEDYRLTVLISGLGNSNICFINMVIFSRYGVERLGAGEASKASYLQVFQLGRWFISMFRLLPDRIN